MTDGMKAETIDGPRGARSADLPSLRALTNLVMREGLVDQFAQLFHPANYENLRICAADGRCVCHVGMTLQNAVLLGCEIRVACIGGVCTHPDYRQQGLASACFDDTVRRARAEGVDLMIVSGDRNLYRMRGCVHVGADSVFTVAAGAEPPGIHQLSAGVTVERMEPGELPLVEACYGAETVRFVRTSEDYGLALQSGWVMNRLSDFLLIRATGEFRGYLIAPRTGTGAGARLAEFAGDRAAILAAVPHLFRRYGYETLNLHVMRHDSEMRSLCEAAGLEAAPAVTPGTITLINFPQLMARLLLLFAQRLGPAAQRRQPNTG